MNSRTVLKEGSDTFMAQRKYTGKIVYDKNKRRIEQLECVLSNMSEPDFNPSRTFNDDELNVVAISYRLMNHRGFGNGGHVSEPTTNSVIFFMNSIQSYLPVELRSDYELWKFNDTLNVQILEEQLKELINEMIDWLANMKLKIEDYLAKLYLVNGKMNHLEILKRRFKNDWSERTETSIDAEVKEDTTIHITFEDA